MLRAEVTLPGLTSSVPTARRFVESLLTSWGHPEAGWAAAVCVSELAANCALHARTEFRVAISVELDVVRMEISDGSLRAPATRDYGTSATTGRGLRMVDECSTAWGVDMNPDGKTVWVLLDTEADRERERDRTEETVDDDALESLLAAFDDGHERGESATQARRTDCAWLVAA